MDDYERIMAELVKQLQTPAKMVRPVEYLRDEFFRQYRTIGFISPSTMGRRQWLETQLQRDPSTCLIKPVLRAQASPEVFHYENRLGRPEVWARTFLPQDVHVLLNRQQFEPWTTIYVDDTQRKFRSFGKQLYEYLSKHQRYETTIVIVG
jgi:hypothetical protein